MYDSFDISGQDFATHSSHEFFPTFFSLNGLHSVSTFQTRQDGTRRKHCSRRDDQPIPSSFGRSKIQTGTVIGFNQQ